MELNVTALMQGLVDSFGPIARLRGVVLEHQVPPLPVCITTSLESVLPSFTAFLVKLLYLLKEGHYCRVTARILTQQDQAVLRLQLTTTKLYFNPNLLVPGIDKILQLDNQAPDSSCIYTDVLMDEPVPAPAETVNLPPYVSGTLASHLMAQDFKKRAEQFAQDRLSIDKMRATGTARDALFLKVVEQTIALHLDSDTLDADLLGRETALSRAQLFRRLKQLTGFSAANYIRHVRLHRATDLLRATQLTIGEVAYRVGFTDLSYFTRSFTEAFGCNPSEWRRQTNTQQ